MHPKIHAIHTLTLEKIGFKLIWRHASWQEHPPKKGANGVMEMAFIIHAGLATSQAALLPARKGMPFPKKAPVVYSICITTVAERSEDNKVPNHLMIRYLASGIDFT
jgi:hypothetical protein